MKYRALFGILRIKFENVFCCNFMVLKGLNIEVALNTKCENYEDTSTFLKVISCFLFFDNNASVFNVWKTFIFTASNLCLLLQKEQNVKGGEGPSGKQAVGINNGTQ